MKIFPVIQNKKNHTSWWKSGDPWVWLNAGGLAICLILVIGLISLLVFKGLEYFTPKQVVSFTHTPECKNPGATRKNYGIIIRRETRATKELIDAGYKVSPNTEYIDTTFYHLGARHIFNKEFIWVCNNDVSDISYPKDVLTLEQFVGGNLYGKLSSINFKSQTINLISATPQDKKQIIKKLYKTIKKVGEQRKEIEHLLEIEIGEVNRKIEKIRLEKKKLQLDGKLSEFDVSRLKKQKIELEEKYEILNSKNEELQKRLNDEGSINFILSDKQTIKIPISNINRIYASNNLSIFGKASIFFSKIWEFLSQSPRDANTAGGIFPALFGTVLMVFVMTIIVTPLGVITAIYMHEYSKSGIINRIIRISINNLAGIPSVVYGIFSLGFFIYFIGAKIDQIFYEEYAPSPVFGTPGLLWASLTLALLTIPVVVVATEEGLSRIPKSIKEASLALGANKSETIWKIILPMTTPAIMTGIILAIARAAGEVAPLMLVGVVKVAPSLPIDGIAPYIHLDQKIMHLGFFINDVALQSPNIEASRPLIYASSLLLLLMIIVLNLTAIKIRNKLREKYKSLE